MVAMSIAEFGELIKRDVFTLDQRRLVVRQAAAMLEQVYVHLWHKRAMYAIDPLQRLRLLEHRLPQLTDVQFHAELYRIFVDLRDAHTTYYLPDPYRTRLATLGILIERCWQDGQPHWIVSKVNSAVVGDTQLVVGTEVTHWNGTPMAVAVERYAQLESGGNAAARLARGLEAMTVRALVASLLPDEEWVVLTHLVDGMPRDCRLAWRVGTAAEVLPAVADNAEALQSDTREARDDLAVDLRTELVRRVKKALFAPVDTDADRLAAGEQMPRRSELKYRTVDTAHGTFGHLRILTFHMKDGDIVAFVEEVRRLLTITPREGLIIDVRGNGGGYLAAAECLLQLLTPRLIEPEPMQFITTPSTAAMCRDVTVPDLSQWLPSIRQSIETGAQYSGAFPVTSRSDANALGQVYHGPIVLITDALCYSATDTFAAGFADHEIGPILGVDDNTGAGGANVWELSTFLTLWPGCPFEPLPRSANLRAALRRVLRVGKNAGQLIEDLGVMPTKRYYLSRRDLLEGNVDLMKAAGVLLDDMPTRRLDVAVSGTGSTVTLALTTSGLDSVDVYVNGRPVRTSSVETDQTSISVPPPGAATVRIQGYFEGALVAARTLRVG